MDVITTCEGEVHGKTVEIQELRHRWGDGGERDFRYSLRVSRTVRHYRVTADGRLVRKLCVGLGYWDDLLCEVTCALGDEVIFREGGYNGFIKVNLIRETDYESIQDYMLLPYGNRHFHDQAVCMHSVRDYDRNLLSTSRGYTVWLQLSVVSFA
ncbi:hypothetical protein CBR_g55166 [Chara braunii]|uniref:Uncharacterized protein n=1 Tax=Chara braunii TaxID=69332 RepID=A0A388MCN2_CHABU|nr:hypothetical protein CBR_g55166 [Chara braunii]|eukprot:GBG92321.1 hypothetical protein CBR_g55166 [Chara braunii]